MVSAGFYSFLKTRWVLFVVLVAFVLFKVPHLFYPYYCDEGWVYAPAVKYMAINGPGLLPGIIPSVYSRGHPLLFHFLCGLWIRCFGSSDLALHSFALTVAVVFLIVLYEGCMRLFGRRVAVLALLLVATQVIFFVQASFVEMEVMVSLLAFLSLYFYAYDRLLLTAVMLAMLYLTKESGLVFGLVIGCHALISFIRKRGTLIRRTLRLVAVVSSVLPVGVFFVLQKIKEGWYLLPLHSSLIHTRWDACYPLFRSCLTWTFCGDKSNVVLFCFVVLLSLFPAIRKRDPRYLFLFLPGIIIGLLCNKYIAEHIGDGLLVGLFILFYAAPFYYLPLCNKDLTVTSRRFLLLLGFSFVAYLCFSSLSVLTYRYLLVDIVLLLVFVAVCIDTFARQFGSSLFYIAVAGIAVIAVFAFKYDEGHDDTDLDAFRAMTVQKKIVAYLEAHDAYDKEVAGSGFWELAHLVDPMQGYLGSARTFTRINWGVAGPNTDYAILDNVWWDPANEHAINDSGFHVIYTARAGDIWSEIYVHDTSKLKDTTLHTQR